jgi:hypothetical protein
VTAGPTYAEPIDAISGLFGGMLVGCAIVAMLLGVAAMGMMTGPAPSYLATLKAKMPLVVGVGLVVILIGGVLGWLAGKASSGRRQAMQQMGA